MDTDPYLSSGVDQSKADNLSHWISKSLQKNSNNLSTPLGHQMNEIGGFAGFFKPNLSSFKEPLLVSSTDGVGSKLLLALQTGTLEQIGIDLVAMCVNDLYTVGAQPLFFLDYFATGTLSAENFKKVLAGIQKGLNECDTVLLGGETAQLPGLYQKDHFDLAGFVVGLVDQNKVLGAKKVEEGDLVIALASSGFHSNGYSLLRKWLNKRSKKNEDLCISYLLKPTTIYKCIPSLIQIFQQNIKAFAHITGGGIDGNLARVIPKGLCANLEWNALETPEEMLSLFLEQKTTAYDLREVFNLGVGMIAVISPAIVSAFIKELSFLGVHAYKLGQLSSREDLEKRVFWHR